MDETSAKKISNKLNVLISLSIRQLLGEHDFSVKEKRKQGVGELARYLNSMGIEAKDIAEITGAPLQSIRTLLTPKRKK